MGVVNVIIKSSFRHGNLAVDFKGYLHTLNDSPT
jgi:hypothetical protein